MIAYALLRQMQVSIAAEDAGVDGDVISQAAGHEFDLVGFCEQMLRIRLWRGCNGQPGQFEIASHLSATRIALRARKLWGQGEFADEAALRAWQRARRDELLARGNLNEAACDPLWDVGQPIRQMTVLQGGHGLGKSVIEAATLLWLLLTSPDISGACYAPTLEKTKETVWRYVDILLAGDWAGEGFDPGMWAPISAGRVSGKISLGHAREIRTKPTTSTRAQGSTKIQGAYGEVGLHIFEEARGITDQSVWDAVRTMVSGREQLWIISENPTQPNSTSAQNIETPMARVYQLSCLDHPNVVTGTTVVPGGIERSTILEYLTGKHPWAQRTTRHDASMDTFELSWQPGVIYRPVGARWYGRVWGRPPPTSSRDSLVNGVLYQQATARGEAWQETFDQSPAARARLALDVARSEEGEGDMGSLARRWRGCIEVVEEIWTRDLTTYERVVADQLDELLDGGCREVEILVDATGIGAGVADRIQHLPQMARFGRATVTRVYFGNPPQDREQWADWITEAYASVNDYLETYALVEPSPQLEEDLCMRVATWRPSRFGGKALDVLGLEPKEAFRKRMGRSPDRGDSIAMVCSPEAPSVAPGQFEAFGEHRWERDPNPPTRRRRRG